MSDEAVTELTERVAAHTELLLSFLASHGDYRAGEVNTARIRADVLTLCQKAQAGASPRPVECVIRQRGVTFPGMVMVEHSTEGVGMTLYDARRGLDAESQVSLGMEGALHLSGELLESARQATTLSARERSLRVEQAEAGGSGP